MNVSYQLNSSPITNQITSQASISYLFGMLLCGLTDQTLMEVCTALGFDIDNKEKMVQQIAQSYSSLNSIGPVKIRNLILSKLDCKQSFIDKISAFGSYEQIPNTLNTTDLTTKINDTVNTNTKGMIKKVVDESEVDGLVLMLLNTIYFYSEWQTKFTKSNTQRDLFHGLAGQRNEQMMNHYRKQFKYRESTTFKVLQMPYENPNFSFVVVLPNEKTAQPLQPTPNELINMLSIVVSVKVNVMLPKFTQETEINLIPVLQKMGVNKLFTEADTGDMLNDDTDTRTKVFVSVLKQKAKIIVDEDGTEASAVTFAGMKCKSMAPRAETVHDFIADHPFSYYILCNNIVLFEGTYV